MLSIFNEWTIWPLKLLVFCFLPTLKYPKWRKSNLQLEVWRSLSPLRADALSQLILHGWFWFLFLFCSQCFSWLTCSRWWGRPSVNGEICLTHTYRIRNNTQHHKYHSIFLQLFTPSSSGFSSILSITLHNRLGYKPGCESMARWQFTNLAAWLSWECNDKKKHTSQSEHTQKSTYTQTSLLPCNLFIPVTIPLSLFTYNRDNDI